MGFIRLPIAVRLLAAFTVVIAITALTSRASIRDFDHIESSVTSQLRDDTVPGLAQMARIGQGVALLRGNLWKHCFTRDAMAMTALEQEIATLRSDLDRQLALYQNSITRDEDRQMYRELKEGLGLYLAKFDQVLAASRRNDDATATPLLAEAGAINQKAIVPLIQRMIDRNIAWANEAVEQIRQESAQARSAATSGAALAGLAGVVVALLLTWHLVRPLSACRRVIDRLAQGCIDDGLSDKRQASLAKRSDELGTIARSVQDLRGYLESMAATAQAISRGDLTTSVRARGADDRLGTAFAAMIGHLRTDIGTLRQSCQALATASDELSAVSAQLSAGAEEASAQSTSASAAGEQVHRSVQTVAAGAEEMGASIREIAGNASMVAERIRLAAEAATQLGTASKDVDRIVKTISEIADRTNLLALNASIEAANAGEAGRGFAVVAGEVKTLAEQSRKAAQAAGEILGRMREHASQVDTATREVRQAVDSVASAVEEQSSTTGEIGRSMGEAAKGTAEIAESMSQVSRAAEETTSGVGQLRQSAGELARMANDLKTVVERFKTA